MSWYTVEWIFLSDLFVAILIYDVTLKKKSVKYVRLDQVPESDRMSQHCTLIILTYGLQKDK